VKPLDAFRAHKRYTLGRRSHCRSCELAAERAIRHANPQRFREKDRAWYAAHREKERAEGRAYIATNLDEVLSKSRARHVANPEKAYAKRCVRDEIHAGRMLPASEQLCFACGTGRWQDADVAMEYHHPDYAQPLQVIAVCSSCHKRYHHAMKERS